MKAHVHNASEPTKSSSSGGTNDKEGNEDEDDHYDDTPKSHNLYSIHGSHSICASRCSSVPPSMEQDACGQLADNSLRPLP